MDIICVAFAVLLSCIITVISVFFGSFFITFTIILFIERLFTFNKIMLIGGGK